MKKRKIAAVLCVSLAAAVVLSGCDKKPGEADVTQPSGGGVVSGTIPAMTTAPTESISLPEYNTETRPLEEGDDYAINKINNRSPEDALPGGYKLMSFSEEDQGKLYANGKSRIIIMAYNYKEDLQSLDVWAENACAVTKVQKIFDACDTEFKDPIKQNILGFEGIRYNYDFTQFEFIPDPDNPDGEKIKSPIGNYKGIYDFFCSDQDAYAITFETSAADWDEQSKNYEAFMNDLEITPTEY